MERLDALVAGLGVLVVAVALGGVVATGPGGAEYRVVFVEASSPLEAQQATFAGDSSTEVPVDVAAVDNLTRLEFTVRISAPGPRAGADALQVTLTGPDGVEETQQAQLAAGGADDATLTFERTVRALPPEQRVRAGSAEGAVAAAAVPPAGDAPGAGAWTVTVAASGGLPVGHVEAHTVVVETVAFAFRGQVQPDALPR